MLLMRLLMGLVMRFLVDHVRSTEVTHCAVLRLPGGNARRRGSIFTQHMLAASRLSFLFILSDIRGFIEVCVAQGIIILGAFRPPDRSRKTDWNSF